MCQDPCLRHDHRQQNNRGPASIYTFFSNRAKSVEAQAPHLKVEGLRLRLRLMLTHVGDPKPRSVWCENSHSLFGTIADGAYRVLVLASPSSFSKLPRLKSAFFLIESIILLTNWAWTGRLGRIFLKWYPVRYMAPIS